MHLYFRAIGFSETMKNLDRLNLIDDVISKPTYRAYTSLPGSEDLMLTEFRMDLGEGYGIALYGTYDSDEEFIYDAVIPYMHNGHISTTEYTEVEERIDGTSFAGTVDDLRLGVTLIFRLLNVVDFLKAGAAWQNMPPEETAFNVSLSALSVEGTVMMPILKTEEDQAIRRERSRTRRSLMQNARSGNEDAMRTLTLGDMDVYSSLVARIRRQEDLYSLVDSTFMPTGVECDLYNVLGEIISCRLTENPYTLEKVWVMRISCNELVFSLCINQKDLYGEPEPGRRFKGIVWMQGEIRLG